MNKALLPVLAMIVIAPIATANAKDILLTCTLPAGSKMALAINNHKVLQGGQPITNLDPRSVTIGPRYITFNQAFSTYINEWSISRFTLQYTLVTVVRPDLHIVFNQKGSCSGTIVAANPAPAWQASVVAPVKTSAATRAGDPG